MSKARAEDQVIPGSVTRELLNITDPSGKGVVVKIVAGTGISIASTGGEAGTGIVTINAVGTAGVNLNTYIKDFLKNAGSEDMNIDGSTVAQTFQFVADPANDIFIEELILTIQDSKIDFLTFGNLAVLATGWDLFLDQGGVTTTIINKAKTIYEIIRPCQAQFDLITKYEGSDEAILMRIKFNKAKLVAGSSDKIRAVVNDNLTGLIRFTAKFIGGRT